MNKWTTTAPTEPGWYWFRRHFPTVETHIVHLRYDPGGTPHFDFNRGFSDITRKDDAIEWQGPIEPEE